MMENGRCYWLDDCGYCVREYNEARTKFLCTKRPSMCEDYIENILGEPIYKRGDDVWYFDNEGFPTICHCDITEVSIKKGQFPFYYVFEKSGRRIGWLPGHSLFPTREALCEHYRKIFRWTDGEGLKPWDFAWIDDKLAELQDRWQEEKVGFDWDDMHDLFKEIAKHYYEIGKDDH